MNLKWICTLHDYHFGMVQIVVVAAAAPLKKSPKIRYLKLTLIGMFTIRISLLNCHLVRWNSMARKTRININYKISSAYLRLMSLRSAIGHSPRFFSASTKVKQLYSAVRAPFTYFAFISIYNIRILCDQRNLLNGVNKKKPLHWKQTESKSSARNDLLINKKKWKQANGTNWNGTNRKHF